MVEVARMMTDENTEAEDIPELTDADLASAIRARVRNRLMRGEIEAGNDITALRRYVRLSPEDFAIAMGISLHTLSSWEQGHTKPDGAALALVRIAARRPRVLRENLKPVPQYAASASEIATAWYEEARRRFADIDSGQVSTLSNDEALRIIGSDE
jgi:putative transcriptional regulator